MDGGASTARTRSAPRALAILLPVLVYLTAVADFAAYSPYSRNGFPLDDAWIHQVYARSFAAGRGFAYNDSAQEAGATSPLWVVATAPAHWAGALFGEEAVPAFVKAIGVAAGVAAILCVFGIASRAGGGAVAASLAASLFALEPRLLFSVLSGMESPLLVALWLGATLAMVARRNVTALVLLGLVPLVRPEAVIVLGVGTIALVLRAPDRALSRRPLAWLALLAPSLLWAAFCRIVNGHWLPNTYYVKAHAHALDWTQLATALHLASATGWGATPVLAVGLAALTVEALRRRAAGMVIASQLLAAPALYILAVLASRRVRLDGYYWTRWGDPAVLALAAACTIGLALCLDPRSWARSSLVRVAGNAAVVRGIVAAVVAGLTIASAAPFTRSYAERRARLASDCRALERMNVEPAHWIHDHTPADAVVAVNDAGTFRYFGNRMTIDLIGLNNADIAFGRLSPAAALDRANWVAVFPGVVSYFDLERTFDMRKTFEIPADEYTPCDCPDQTRVLIGERRVRPVSESAR